MSSPQRIIFAIFIVLIFSNCQTDKTMTDANISAMYAKMDFKPPVPKKVAKELTIHDDTELTIIIG